MSRPLTIRDLGATKGPEDHMDCFRFEVEEDVTYSLTMSVGESNAGTANPWFLFDVVSEDESVLLDEQKLQSGQEMSYELETSGPDVAILCVWAGQPTALFDYAFQIEVLE